MAKKMNAYMTALQKARKSGASSFRSEERRVGKECRSGRSTCD